MAYIITVLSFAGAILYFFAFKESNYTSDTLLLGIICSLVFFIFGIYIEYLRNIVKENKKELEELKKRLPPKAEAEENNDTKKDGE